MSFMWILIAAILYFEIGLTILLVLPVFRARRWSQIFKSRFFAAIKAQMRLYLLIVFGILILFFAEAIRETMKYSDHKHSHDANYTSEMQSSMRMFRAQRNLYISGFTLFLSFVIRRLVILIITESELEISLEAALKQGQSASDTARALMSQVVPSAPADDTDPANENAHLKEVALLKEKLKNMTTAKDDLARKYETLSKDFDRVSVDLQKLTGAKSATKKEN